MDDFAQLAKALEAAGVPHEMTAYGGAPHGFTEFDSNRYHKDADQASWNRFLEFLEETRRRLLSNLVHELGRPLGALRSAVHALRHGADEDPGLRQELLAGMDLELRTLEPLLDDLAQLHGQVLNVMSLEREPQPVGEWLQALLPPWRQAALEKGLHWKADVPQDLPPVELDAERMAQAVGNLLSNAIKHTRPGDEVAVSARRNGMQVQITIADSGPGIAPEEQNRIFEPFYRGKQQARFPQGLGLGLTIARDLITAHEGRLDVESAPGAGSTFTVSLPLHNNQDIDPDAS
jgi:signal transduction histidine kinase